MRKTGLDMVYELAKNDERIFFIGSDLGCGTLDQFKENIPERFLVEGISEANVVGMAAGLAMSGKIVYVNTITTFLTRRAYEQVALDMGLHNTNVRLLGNGGGLVYAPLGPTHQAIEDLALMRAIPNMTVIAPCDAEEMKRVMPLTVDYQGPIYIRFAKGYDPVVSRNDIPFEIGKALVMREGSDALIVTTGITLRLALEAAEQLRKDGIEATVLHMPTIKPFDAEALIHYARPAKAIVTIEEHSVIGGLGGAVAETLMEAGFEEGKKFKRIGIPDQFTEHYGSQESLMKRMGITADNLVLTVNQLMSSVSLSQ